MGHKWNIAQCCHSSVLCQTTKLDTVFDALSFETIVVSWFPVLVPLQKILWRKMTVFAKMAYEGSNELPKTIAPKLLVGLPKMNYFWKAVEICNKIHILDWIIGHFLTHLWPLDRFHCQYPPPNPKGAKLVFLISQLPVGATRKITHQNNSYYHNKWGNVAFPWLWGWKHTCSHHYVVWGKKHPKGEKLWYQWSYTSWPKSIAHL